MKYLYFWAVFKFCEALTVSRGIFCSILRPLPTRGFYSLIYFFNHVINSHVNIFSVSCFCLEYFNWEQKYYVAEKQPMFFIQNRVYFSQPFHRK